MTVDEPDQRERDGGRPRDCDGEDGLAHPFWLRLATSKLAVWRSPIGQPRWARPMLLAVAALAGLSYTWGIGNFPLEPFYAAAARSMGSSWKDFFFGAVDPAGTTSLDKLPGAIWLQALSVRLFGFHYWAVALPQAVAGVLTVLVLYRVVRRHVGPKAGMVAALVLAASPVTAMLNRGNVSDSLLILLTVLAADATIRAVTTGRLGSLVMAGVWVGLAFQTKMLQAWLIVPALFATYLLAAPGRFYRRLGHVGVAGLATVVVSLSWMSMVAVVPSHDRPYVDGTTDDSIFVQVFVYNGWERIGIHADANKIVHGGQPFLALAQRGTPEVGTFRIKASPERLLVGPLGRDDAWLLPAALLSAIAVLLSRRRASRRDPIRAAVILWGSWLLVLFGFFSFGKFVNSYYTAALVPAIAALCATGLAVSWRTRTTSWVSRTLLLGIVPLTLLYDLVLLPSRGDTRWIVLLAAAVCVVAEVVLMWSIQTKGSQVLASGVAVASAALSILLVPALTTAVVVADGLGSFSTPYQSVAATRGTTTEPEQYQRHGASVAAFYERVHRGAGIVAVVDTAALAAPLIMVTGREVLPIGGYGGNDPSPTLGELRDLIDHRRVNLFIIPDYPAGDDPRLGWIRSHCGAGFPASYGNGAVLGNYTCEPSSASRAATGAERGAEGYFQVDGEPVTAPDTEPLPEGLTEVVRDELVEQPR